MRCATAAVHFSNAQRQRFPSSAIYHSSSGPWGAKPSLRNRVTHCRANRASPPRGVPMRNEPSTERQRFGASASRKAPPVCLCGRAEEGADAVTAEACLRGGHRWPTPSIEHLGGGGIFGVVLAVDLEERDHTILAALLKNTESRDRVPRAL
ncbi:hypothetical protein MRX96_005238 [Rhipicephalus microplus]